MARTIGIDSLTCLQGRGKARKVAEQVDGTGDGGVHFESTNIGPGFIFLQQPSIMATWWAPYEAKFKIGLANRS